MDAVNTNRPIPEPFRCSNGDMNVASRDTPLDFMIGSGAESERSRFQYGTNLITPFASARRSIPHRGPLFNQRGEVIGINFYGGQHVLMQNHNWAVPINLAKDFAFQVLQTGRFERPWLGLDIVMPAFVRSAEQYLEFAEKFRGDEVKVYGVRPDSPASRAGLLEGDVVLEVDGRAFGTPEDVRAYVFDLEIGAMVEFLVRREGREERIFCEVGPKRNYDAEFSV
jgi:membrane-associated protease RseP (regulator of RpoE activity)